MAHGACFDPIGKCACGSLSLRNELQQQWCTRFKTIPLKAIVEIRPGKSACHEKKTDKTDWPPIPQPGLKSGK